ARAATLHSTLIQLLAGPDTATSAADAPAGDAHAAVSPTPLRVLLAEDNHVNQKVAQLMLAKLGHRVDTVANGREAVQALRHADYDVVLMDVQMPVLDGLAATAEIRRRERVGGRRRTPILALTAHALEDDRRRCLEAGMDGYVAKPIRHQDLYDALAPWAGAGPGDAFRLDALDRLYDGDANLIHELLASALATAPPSIARVEEALAAGDLGRVAAEAHGLKGICLTIGAGAAASSWAALESLGRRGDLPGARAAHAPALAAWEALRAALEAHRRGCPDPAAPALRGQ
ncbi:MAG TPA: response regulator, partial [Isosphaeraceae bacterium]